MSDSLLDLATDVIARAQRLGATSADAMAAERSAREVAVLEGTLEKLEQSEVKEVGLRVFVGQSSAMIAGSVLNADGLQRLAEMAVAMAKEAPADPYAGLAETSQLASSDLDLDLVSTSRPAPDELKAMALAAEAAAKSIEGVSKSGGASASASRRRTASAGTNGLSRTSERTGFSVGATAIAGNGTGMQRDYDYSSAVHFSDLRTPEAVGLSAGERTIARLKPRKVASQSVPVIFDRRVAAGLVGHFVSAINGAAIARGTSFLKDRLGERVFASGITIVDDPLRPRGLASRTIDGEGLAAIRRKLADDGILTTWLLDLRSARQLNLQPTGHGSRGLASPPSPSAYNLHMESGQQTPAEMIAGIETGLLVTEMIGMGVNQVTGDYSRGASGMWIENGHLAYPVSEITIAGNLKDMFLRITPANDLEFRFATNAPTLLVEGMTVAGA